MVVVVMLSLQRFNYAVVKQCRVQRHLPVVWSGLKAAASIRLVCKHI